MHHHAVFVFSFISILTVLIYYIGIAQPEGMRHAAIIDGVAYFGSESNDFKALTCKISNKVADYAVKGEKSPDFGSPRLLIFQLSNVRE